MSGFEPDATKIVRNLELNAMYVVSGFSRTEVTCKIGDVRWRSVRRSPPLLKMRGGQATHPEGAKLASTGA